MMMMMILSMMMMIQKMWDLAEMNEEERHLGDELSQFWFGLSFSLDEEHLRHQLLHWCPTLFQYLVRTHRVAGIERSRSTFGWKRLKLFRVDRAAAEEAERWKLGLSLFIEQEKWTALSCVAHLWSVVAPGSHTHSIIILYQAQFQF